MNREFWHGSKEPEVYFLERELGVHQFTGVVALHSEDTANGAYAFVRGATLTEALAKPALAAAGFLPLAAGEIIDGFPARAGLISQCYEGVLSHPAELHPLPFETLRLPSLKRSSMKRRMENGRKSVTAMVAMHHENLSRWQHEHRYTTGSPLGESRTLIVTGLTAAMMILEIVAGHFLRSMALFADGWHMGTHVVALGISAFAYVYARRHAADAKFAFGPGKIGPLGGYTSAIILFGVALYIAFEGITRLLHPLPIGFNEAIAVACVGLSVNLLSAYLLRDDHHHHHGHGHDHDHDHHEHGHGTDLNLRAAYIHVLADAATSVAAIVALTLGKFFGWSWLDPLVGTAGALVVGQWAYSLVRDTSRVLLDREMDPAALEEIREAIESDGDSVVSDLHLLRVGLNEFAVVASIVTDEPRTPEDYKARIRQHEELAHVTIEVNRCEEHAEVPSGHVASVRN